MPIPRKSIKKNRFLKKYVHDVHAKIPSGNFSKPNASFDRNIIIQVNIHTDIYIRYVQQ